MQVVLTWDERDIWLGHYEASGDGWSVRKRTLHGGLRDGVDVIEVTAGDLSFSILPTRGMGLWRGRYRDCRLGWDAPVAGPVHPKYVNLADRGGLGWLTGFDEWLCRCGLAWNGPPGVDHGWPITLHGRIANQPARYVSITQSGDTIVVRGVVEEGGLYYSRLGLETAYSVTVGSPEITIEDKVVNGGGRPAEFQMLYHVNFGQPLLGAGSRVCVPMREVWPLGQQAAESIDSFDRCLSPMAGADEQVYCGYTVADEERQTLAILHDAEAHQAVALRWCVDDLPCFNLWRNFAGEREGYVVGLEPATGFPLFKAKEREARRVLTLQPNQIWSTRWRIGLAANSSEVARLVDEVARIQARSPMVVHRRSLI